MRLFKLVATTGLVLLGACDCGDDARPAIELTPVDASSGLPIASGVSATATDGQFSEDFLVNGSELRVAFGRPGRYTVEVMAEGYLPWTRGDLVAEDADCGLVETVFVEARLEPKPGP